MRVGVMAVVVVMLVSVVSMRLMLMPTPNWNWHAIGLTSTGAFALTQIAAIRQSLHMVVVAGLG